MILFLFLLVANQLRIPGKRKKQNKQNKQTKNVRRMPMQLKRLTRKPVTKNRTGRMIVTRIKCAGNRSRKSENLSERLKRNKKSTRRKMHADKEKKTTPSPLKISQRYLNEHFQKRPWMTFARSLLSPLCSSFFIAFFLSLSSVPLTLSFCLFLHRKILHSL